MIKTFAADTSALPDPCAAGREAWMEGLPQERVEKIRRIRHSSVRKQSLGAGLLLKNVLGRMAPGAELKTNPYGKPVCADIPFNLSHTEDAVILSVWSSQEFTYECLTGEDIFKECLAGKVSDDRFAGKDFTKQDTDYLIGCDIEQVRTYKSGIARRFFTRAEYESLEAVKDPQEQAELFCRYWTKKESVMKLTGLGMSLPMELYDVRGSQVVVDTGKTVKWYEDGLKKGRAETEYGQAVRILLNRSLYLKEYRWQNCCITVCSLADRFAPELFVV